VGVPLAQLIGAGLAAGRGAAVAETASAPATIDAQASGDNRTAGDFIGRSTPGGISGRLNALRRRLIPS
jgi:hypothetical protein